MEKGTNKDPAQHKEKPALGTAGWVKKAHGRLLTSYKERYIVLEKTEIAVYENEDLQNCLERFDLENYDKCHELKSPFKKKHRLILIRSSKCGNKVHDVKLQAQSAEEKEAWINTLSKGIDRAKNKAFDEVKVESNHLEHVTRTRPKGNRNRRPPTRIHMKEVAIVSSDGLLRLDLDLEDAIMPNGTRQSCAGWTATLKEEEEKSELESCVQMTTVEPSIVPTKADEATSAKDINTDENPDKEVQSLSNETTAVDGQIPAVKNNPPAPPNKPSDSLRNLVVTLQTPRVSVLPSSSLTEENLSHQTGNLEHEDDLMSTADQGREQDHETVKDKHRDRLSETRDSTESLSKSISPLLTRKQNHENPVQQKKTQSTPPNTTANSSASDPTNRPSQPPKPLQRKLPSNVLPSAQPPSNGHSQSPRLWKRSIEEETSVESTQRRSNDLSESKDTLSGLSSLKARSASHENMLSDSFICSNAAESAATPGDEFTDLQAKVALEMENTKKLLSKAKDGTCEEGSAEELLAQAMEKLRKADHVLRELKKQKVQSRTSNRLSW